MIEKPAQATFSSRREFLKQTGTAITGATLAGALARGVHAAEDNTIRVALVGCGRRGTGAALNALSTTGPTRLVAMADAFDFRTKASLKQLVKRPRLQVDVPPERQFAGLDAYRGAIDAVAPGGVVILATPPAFRPIHLEYAVAKGCHVFMEKSFGVDVPGVRRVVAAGKEAEKKNLKIAGGLMSRHCPAQEEAVKRIHDGEIGEVITAWAYRMHGPAPAVVRHEGIDELGLQLTNYNCFTWLCGSFMLDWMIHNLDIACWAKQAWPVAAQGQCGRQVRSTPDQMLDHYAVEYTFADGTRMMAQGRHMDRCWGCRDDVIHGTKGSAILGENKPKSALYRGYNVSRADLLWRYRGPMVNSYQREHDLLFEAIREDKPYNETERCAMATITGILGRMAAESGQWITWDEAMASDRALTPELDKMTLNSPPPVVPDANGRYPLPVPGVTKPV